MNCVKKLYASVFIIGLSPFNQQAIIRNMMDNGASDYVLKNATKEELLAAIQKVMKGDTYFSWEAVESLKDTESKAPCNNQTRKRSFKTHCRRTYQCGDLRKAFY
ncbi:MAG: response regulator transcription factor [Cyclobacteriaceae bacterium]|nr:response regulator transcription factor [Cyclobacteriaceae bacterium]